MSINHLLLVPTVFTNTMPIHRILGKHNDSQSHPTLPFSSSRSGLFMVPNSMPRYHPQASTIVLWRWNYPLTLMNNIFTIYKNRSLINYEFTLKKLHLPRASPRHLLLLSPQHAPLIACTPSYLTNPIDLKFPQPIRWAVNFNYQR